MQVASRFLLVWGIAQFFPETVARSTAYTTMLLAWSTTEVIRYSYFAVNLKDGKVPAWLTWLRYNTFFVLYPLGISSECWLVWLATEPARKMDWRVEWALWAVLAVYVPGECEMDSNLRQSVWMLMVFRVVYSVHAYDGAEAEGHAWRELSEEAVKIVTVYLKTNQAHLQRFLCVHKCMIPISSAVQLANHFSEQIELDFTVITPAQLAPYQSRY